MTEAEVPPESSPPAPSRRPSGGVNRGEVDRGGVLVVDKPAGPTSHDIVARGRRALGTRAVGHAGTLDPAATGVLVLLFGEGTKLASYLTADDKQYQAVIQLGSETDSLDADGTVVRQAPVPELSTQMVEAALESFRGSHVQQVPLVSAVKVAGQALHKRVRRGEEGLEAPVREVVLRDVKLERLDDTRIHVGLRCSKGFYVRSFARDVATKLGTLGHVSALRRTHSGALSLEQAVPRERFDEAVVQRERAILSPWCISLEDAWTGASFRLNSEGVTDALHGRQISPARLLQPEAFSHQSQGEVCALIDDEDSMMVALGRIEDDAIRIARGLRREE